MKFVGDFKILEDLGYHTNVDNTYYFKSYGRYGAIFILTTTKEILNEGRDRSDEYHELIKELENYIIKENNDVFK